MHRAGATSLRQLRLGKWLCWEESLGPSFGSRTEGFPSIPVGNRDAATHAGCRGSGCASSHDAQALWERNGLKETGCQ